MLDLSAHLMLNLLARFGESTTALEGHVSRNGTCVLSRSHNLDTSLRSGINTFSTKLLRI